MSDLVILTPVLGRPHRIKPLLASIEEATPHARVVFLTDPGDDPTSSAIRRASKATKLRVKAIPCGGNYAHKINHGVAETAERFIFLGADDLHYHPGWYVFALSKVGDGFQVIGTNDLSNRRVIAGHHSTHSLVTRQYTEQGTIDDPTPGMVLHEGYVHEFVDDEFIATAKYREAFAMASNAIVEHLHPMVGKAPMDDMYAAAPLRMRQGRQLFRRREALWT